MEKLRDKTAVITGASSGIGNAIAIGLATCGVNLHLLGRNRQVLEDMQQALTAEHGIEVSVHSADFQEVGTLADQLQALRNKRIDFLIHSAGQIFTSTIEETSSSDHDRLFDINYRAPCEVTRLLLPKLRESGGTVVFVNSSTSQQAGKAGLSAYSSSKLALKAWSECLRAEENANGIRVVNVFPGRTASAMQEAIHRSEGKPYDASKLLQCADVADTVIHALNQADTSEITDISIRPFQKS